MTLRILRPLLFAAAVLAVPVLASAKRAQVPAKSATTMRAEPAESAAVVAPVKAGDKLTVIESRPDWSQVANAAGKKGWVPTKVVGEPKGTAKVATGNTTVAAAEGSTAMAVRGKPGKRRAVVMGAGLPEASMKKVTDALRGNPKLDVVEPDVVVMVKPSTGTTHTYEVLDAKTGAVLGAGTAKDLDEAMTAVGASLETTSAVAPAPMASPAASLAR